MNGLLIRRWLFALSALMTLAGASPANAADDKKTIKSLQERLQKIQQTAQQEKVQLVAEKADAERQLVSLRGEAEHLRAASRRQAVTLRDLEAARGDQEKLRLQVAELERQLAETRQKLQAAEESAAQGRQAAQTLQRDLDRRVQALGQCEKQNQGMYQLNGDLLARYEKTAGGGGLLAGLTQLDKVRVENDGAACRDRLDELKVAPPGKPH